MTAAREFFMFHNLKAQGLSISEIARHQNCDRKTVRKHLHADRQDAAALRRQAGPGKLDPYQPCLEDRVSRYPGAFRAPAAARDHRAGLQRPLPDPVRLAAHGAPADQAALRAAL